MFNIRRTYKRTNSITSSSASSWFITHLTSPLSSSLTTCILIIHHSLVLPFQPQNISVSHSLPRTYGAISTDYTGKFTDLSTDFLCLRFFFSDFLVLVLVIPFSVCYLRLSLPQHVCLLIVFFIIFFTQQRLFQFTAPYKTVSVIIVYVLD